MPKAISLMITKHELQSSECCCTGHRSAAAGVRDGTCWTLGADSADSADIDYEAAWRASLRRDHRCHFKGEKSARLQTLQAVV